MEQQCPVCGGQMWDNRPKKQSGEINPKGPDFKCKDKNCTGVIWPQRGGKKSFPQKAFAQAPNLEQPPPHWNPPRQEPPEPTRNPPTDDRERLIQWGQAVNLAAKCCEGKPMAPTEITSLADKFFAVLSNPPWDRQPPSPPEYTEEPPF